MASWDDARMWGYRGPEDTQALTDWAAANYPARGTDPNNSAAVGRIVTGLGGRFNVTTSAAAAGGSYHELVSSSSLPPLPHPDASNLSLGPNLGGSDAVTFPGEKKPQGAGEEDVSGGFGGIALLVGLVLVVVLLSKK